MVLAKTSVVSTSAGGCTKANAPMTATIPRANPRLYGAYNFMIVSGKDTFGFFIDYPGKVTFDCGYTDMDTLRVTVAEEKLRSLHH